MTPLLRVAALSILLLAGCSDDEPTLDTSSDKALEESLERMSSTLSSGEAQKLAAAIIVIRLPGLIQGGSANDIRSLDGMTAKEAIAFVENLVAEKEANKSSNASAEIEDLKLKRKETLAQIKTMTVSNVRYEWPSGSYSFTNDPEVTFTITNGGDVALGGIKFRVTVASPGRKKPWSVDDSPFGISGGLEPGESREFRVSAGSFSVAWKKLDLFGRDDLEVTVEVDGVETVEEDRDDGLYHGSSISRIDDRLDSLQN